MLKVNKGVEPQFLIEYKKKINPKNWDDYDHEIKEVLRTLLLIEEQDGYCPYCERSIHDNDEWHIEHIKPQDKFPKEFQDYNNLLVSCNHKGTCGISKGSKYSEDFINPVVDNPKEFLQHDLATGKISPMDSEGKNYQKANYTIEVLNLNEKSLLIERRNFNKSLIAIKSNYSTDDFRDYLVYCLQEGQSFKSLYELHLK